MIPLGSFLAIWLSISERVDFSRYKDRGVPVLYSETVDSVLIEEADELGVLELQEGEVFGTEGGTQVFWGWGPELRLIFRSLRPGPPVKVLWAKRADRPWLPQSVGYLDASMAWDPHRRAAWIAMSRSLPGDFTVDLQRVDFDSRFEVMGLPAPTRYYPNEKSYHCYAQTISVVADKDAVNILPKGLDCSNLILRFIPGTELWQEGIVAFTWRMPCGDCVK